MTRRRRRVAESSLELLLDTICNTFGGVLFLAILVSVLLRTTSRFDLPETKPAPSAADLAQLAQRQEEASARLQALRQAAAQQQRIVEQFTRPENADLLDAVAKLRARRDALSDERLRLLGQIAKSKAKSLEVTAELEQLDVSIATAAREVQAVELALQSELSSRTQTARLPRERASLKQEVGVVLRFDRLYIWHKYDQFGSRIGLNTDEFVVTKEESGYLETKPKPYAGVPAADPEFHDELRTRLKLFNPSRQHVTVLVWDDSFDAFQAVKKALIDEGFEYRLMPLKDGDPVMDQGGSGGRVQ